MDIKEIREKKQELTDGILALLDTFYDVTGVRITTINVMTLPRHDDSKMYGIDVIVERI